MAEMGWDDRQKAYSTLRAVLHTLRNRLIVDEAADLGAQLPLLVRGFYYENWRPAGKPLKYRHKEEFLNQVKEKPQGFDLDGAGLEQAVSAAFKVLSTHVAGGEIEEVRQQLPEEVRALWP